MMGYPFHPG